MGTLKPKYLLYGYMEPLGPLLVVYVCPNRNLRIQGCYLEGRSGDLVSR